MQSLRITVRLGGTLYSPQCLTKYSLAGSHAIHRILVPCLLIVVIVSKHHYDWPREKLDNHIRMMIRQGSAHMPLYTACVVNAGQLVVEPDEEPQGHFGPEPRPRHGVDRVYRASKQVVLDPAVGCVQRRGVVKRLSSLRFRAGLQDPCPDACSEWDQTPKWRRS